VQAWLALKNALRLLICLKICYDEDFEACSIIQDVCKMPKVVATTTSGAYISTEPEAYKRLPIAIAMGDNSSAWQKHAKDELGLDANFCQTQATAIAANNGSHKKYFDNVNENYDGFYEFVNRIMRCSFAAVGENLQALLVEWLRSVRESRGLVREVVVRSGERTVVAWIWGGCDVW
jgi:hypothetical protein